MHYDETGSTSIISSLEELKTYIRQNEDPEIQRRRYIREYLRALDVRSHLIRSDDRTKQFVFPFLRTKEWYNSVPCLLMVRMLSQRSAFVLIFKESSMSGDVTLVSGKTKQI